MITLLNLPPESLRAIFIMETFCCGWTVFMYRSFRPFVGINTNGATLFVVTFAGFQLINWVGLPIFMTKENIDLAPYILLAIAHITTWLAALSPLKFSFTKPFATLRLLLVSLGPVAFIYLCAVGIGIGTFGTGNTLPTYRGSRYDGHWDSNKH